MAVKIAILGFGTVGSGVYELNPGRVGRVLDLREIDSVKNILTHNFEDILNDDTISIVIETMGGLEPAYDYVKRSLTAGKSVVTSNKALVAEHCAEFTQTAKLKNVSFLYEAAVGGGIPIIRTLRQLRFVDKITEISGILNGTTNYILTKMEKSGSSFEDALIEAQKLGYAEANPASDIEGFDSARKIAILASLVTEKHVDFTQIPTIGVSKITAADIKNAAENGYTIKLIASAKFTESNPVVFVEPLLVHKEHAFSTVSGCTNAVSVKFANIGEFEFEGPGAGKLPTAGAIASNIIDIESVNGHISCGWNDETAKLGSHTANMGKLREWLQ